ncbi:MAG TPA: hypothetical protein VGL81_37175 [Polyangiaceae bacterium]|jgi:hypothetical protein
MAKGWDRSLFVGALGIVASAACSSTGVPESSDGGASASCANAPTVEDVTPPTGPQQCATCSPSSTCTSSEPLDACCNWVAEPHDALADGINLHRYSTTNASATPDLSCLAQAGTLGTPQMVTLTGYVWLFSSGVDSQGVNVAVYTENTPTTPDGSISSAPISMPYTTSMSDPIDPTEAGTLSEWNTKCPNGCSYRQYTIQNVPTETPLVIVTSDGGSNQWATLYDYNIYFKNSDVQGGMVSYNATAVAGPDLSTVTGTLGLTLQNGMGLLAGEVHDCSDIRLFGATVETTGSHEGPLVYFTEDESDPLPTYEAHDTSHLGLFGAINMQPGMPIRVSAVGEDPANAGQFLMLGTYVVQVYTGAVTAVSLRGRRPWQP